MTFVAVAIGGSALIAGGISAANQASANSANVSEAEKNRQFQERMANTAYQRSMADKKAAGINPILDRTPGMTPGGSQASVQSEGDLGVGEAGLAYASIKAQQQDMAQKKAQTDLTESMQTTEKIKQAQMGSAAMQAADDAKVRRAQVPADIQRTDINKKMAWPDKIIDSVSRILNGGSSAHDMYRRETDRNMRTYEDTKIESYNRKGEHTGTTHKKTGKERK